jgi:predicted transcriptional regulator
MTKRLPRPTDAELAILRVLWDLGPSTVRQVHDVLGRTRQAGYTTVLKLMQIMAEKGLLRRDERERTHVYQPELSEGETQRQLVGDLLDRAFKGSAARLVMQALDARETTPEELAEIRRLLDERRGAQR